MDSKELLTALVAYGCFGSMGHTDYGDDVYPLGSEVSCSYPYKFEDFFPNVDAKFLREQLVAWLLFEKIPNVQG